MSYFIRFILTEGDLKLAQIDTALHNADPDFRIQFDQSEPESGDLYYGDAVIGEIAVNRATETVFDEDVQELREIIAPLEDSLKPLVQTALDNAGTMVALRVLEAGHDNPDILETLWDWLFSHYKGMLQVDDEGFYDYEGLILPVTPDES